MNTLRYEAKLRYSVDTTNDRDTERQLLSKKPGRDEREWRMKEHSDRCSRKS